MNAPVELSAQMRAQRQREVVQALMAVLPPLALVSTVWRVAPLVNVPVWLLSSARTVRLPGVPL